MFNKFISWQKSFLGLLGELLWKKRKIAFLLYFALLLNIICWSIFFWLFKVEQSFVVLHYNAFLGIDAVADMDLEKNYPQMYFAPAGGLFFWVFNFVIVLVLGTFSDFFQKKETAGGNKLDLGGKASQCRIPDPGVLGIFLVLSGGVVLQFALLLYTLSIVMVNR